MNRMLLPFILLVLCGCMSSGEKSSKISIELQGYITDINDDIVIMESLYDSSLVALERSESWESIHETYSDSLSILFSSLNQKISELNGRAKIEGLDSIAYENVFSKIRLEKVHVKLDQLKSAGYQYKF